jgi:hypothetical protein
MGSRSEEASKPLRREAGAADGVPSSLKGPAPFLLLHKRTCTPEFSDGYSTCYTELMPGQEKVKYFGPKSRAMNKIQFSFHPLKPRPNQMLTTVLNRMLVTVQS